MALNDGQGQFTVGGSYRAAENVWLGDIDGDGDVDLSSYALGLDEGNQVYAFANLLSEPAGP